MSKRIKLQAIPINRTDYCQFLIVSQKNYSLTYYAEHAKKCSHDVINRFLRNEKYTPSLLWEHIKNDVIFSSNGYTIFDDTVLNKRNTKQIEIARSQYSGATGRVTKGIGVVSLVYYNPDINKFWVIDYRIFAPDHDGATKLEHLLNMLNNAAKLTLCLVLNIVKMENAAVVAYNHLKALTLFGKPFYRLYLQSF
ncbi:hypothetical protein [Rickettsia endosymbiont of Gonocerus acuteangulatus]|uniref:hypothetical protein n=1 Tax=Rickettsia endosymbiont of Gonocerus acuteangulatus TaxID=3066266 RepID=UPI0031332F09